MSNGHTGHGTENNMLPWPKDRWMRRIEGIEVILGESIAMAEKLEQERREAIAESEEGNDYGLLPGDYSAGAMASLFQTDSELLRIQIGLLMLRNLSVFLSGNQVANSKFLKKELAEIFENNLTGVFSESYIYRQLLSRISTDINIIQQALLQRRLNSKSKITHQGYVLHVASVVANAALTRVRKAEMLPLNVVSLTYLQDRIDIRLIPYFDAILLSIPYGAMNSTCDWLATDYLAIPHEIGHYLYWWGRGTFREQSSQEPIREFLETKTADEPEWVKTWLEEMFADAVCCLIAGPVSVLGFQELLTSSSPYDLLNHFKHDHAHPFPSLRPFIQTGMLRKLNLFGSAPDNLDGAWDSWVAENWPGSENPRRQIYLVGDDDLMRGEDIINYLARQDGPLDHILTSLNALKPINEDICWTGDQSLEDMYKAFTSGSFIKASDIEAADLSSFSDKAFMRAQRMVDPDTRLKEMFGGWSTEGPHGGNSGL